MTPASYRELVPPRRLRADVWSLWVHRVSGSDWPYIHRSVPNGSVHLSCQLGRAVEILGPSTRPLARVLGPGTTVVGVRFRPGTATSVLAGPASELVDLSVPAGDLTGRWGTELSERSLKITVPENLEEPPRVDLYASLFGDVAEAVHLLTRLIDRGRVEPESTTITSADYGRTRRFWATLGATDPGEGRSASMAAPVQRQYAKSEFFRRPVPVDVIERLLTALTAGRGAAQFRELDFMPWGGAYGSRRPDETAFVHRDETFLLKQSIKIPALASRDDQVEASHRVGAMWATTHPVGSKRSFQNFADPELTDWAAAYYAENYERLTRLKTVYDPGDVFRHGQSIPVR